MPAWIFRACAHRGLALELLNLGGGLPAHYRAPVPPLSAYAEAIETAVAAEFGGNRPRILVEPGRYLVGASGLLRTEILLISRKSLHERERWVYLDAGSITDWMRRSTSASIIASARRVTAASAAL